MQNEIGTILMSVLIIAAILYFILGIIKETKMLKALENAISNLDEMLEETQNDLNEIVKNAEEEIKKVEQEEIKKIKKEKRKEMTDIEKAEKTTKVRRKKKNEE